MQVRIQTLPNGQYQISEASTGQPIQCRALELSLAVEKAPSLKIELVAYDHIDVVAGATEMTTTMPDGKRYRLVPLDEPTAPAVDPIDPVDPANLIE